MSLYCTPQDLELEGLPTAATALVAASRMRMCQAASNEADTYLSPGRYTLPLAAVVGLVEHVPATGSTGTGTITVTIPSGVTIVRAYGVRLEVLTTGGSGVATARVSIDSGITWQQTFTIATGARTVTLSSTESLTLTFDSGTWFDGDLLYIPVSYKALTSACVAIASRKLLRRRGFDADAAYEETVSAAKEAVKWLEGVRDNKNDPGLTDSSTSTNEGGFLYAPETEYEGDRRWDSVMGRVARSQPANVSTTDDMW